jgi:hypothetical protein
MIRERTLITDTLIALVVPGSLAIAGSALATPTTYDITFAGTFPLPAEGSFTYDPALVQSFSDFHVVWDGLDFDLTGAANAPAISGDCGVLAPPQLAFALLSHIPSKCTSNSSANAGFQGDQRFFGFVGDYDANLNAYSVSFGASIGEPCPPGFLCNIGSTFGTFDIAPQATAVPEPSILVMVITGLASLRWSRRYRFPIAGRAQWN